MLSDVISEGIYFVLLLSPNSDSSLDFVEVRHAVNRRAEKRPTLRQPRAAQSPISYARAPLALISSIEVLQVSLEVPERLPAIL